VSLPADSAAQLGIYAQLAVGFAGFAGVIGAFSRFRMHAEATAFRVRAMVALALLLAVFSLLPMLVAGFGVSEAGIWRICSGVLAVVSSVAVAIMVRQASVLYRVGRLMKWAAYVLSTIATLLILPLFAVAAGFLPAYAEAFYFALMFFALVTCSYHFILLMVAVRLDESEGVASAELWEEPSAKQSSGGSHEPRAHPGARKRAGRRPAGGG